MVLQARPLSRLLQPSLTSGPWPSPRGEGVCLSLVEQLQFTSPRRSQGTVLLPWAWQFLLLAEEVTKASLF